MKGLDNLIHELKAPKGRWNDFSNFYYRSCEDILEAVKPLLKKNGLSLRITDEPLIVGTFNYIRATATLTDSEQTITVSAVAREAETKKGMDSAQITGATSSYARKYALNGLFLIDDSNDSDLQGGDNPDMATEEQRKQLKDLAGEMNQEGEEYIRNELEKDLTYTKAQMLIDRAKSKLKGMVK